MNKLFTIYWDLDKPAKMAGKILDITRYDPNDIVVSIFRGIAQLRSELPPPKGGGFPNYL